jgi:ABC-type sugar transport system substrate-binding protein
MKRFRFALTIALAVFTLFSSQVSTFGQKAHPVVGAILFASDSFFQSIRQGMQAEADKLGVELIVNIHEHKIDQEKKYIEDYITRGVDAIVITPESVDASVPALQDAADAGIKIVCFNTCVNQKAQDAFVSAFYETDQASLGNQTGAYLAKWVQANKISPVNIGISQCDFVEACKQRGAGFRQALKDAGVQFNEVANQEGYQPDVASTVGENELQAHPEINVLWAENEGGTVGLTLAVQSMGLKDKVHVFGTDISPQIASMLLANDGILMAVTGQSPEVMGGSAIKAAVDVVNGGKGVGHNIVPNAFYSRDKPADVQAYIDAHNNPATPAATAAATASK